MRFAIVSPLLFFYVGLVMVMFNVDLDNTLIYSYKREIGKGKKCVEWYDGREVSFLSDRTWELLQEVARRVLLVPTTTRTAEQYGRIDLGVGKTPYALVCNGGVLLVDGAEEEDWYRESLEGIQESRHELEKAGKELEKDGNRCLDVRNIRDLFLFTKSGNAEESAARLRQALDGTLVDVFSGGMKVYVMPKSLTKGNAVMRLKDRLRAGKVAVAGDSGLDVSMLKCADMGIAPAGLEIEGASGTIVRIGDGGLFSERMLERLLDWL